MAIATATSYSSGGFEAKSLFGDAGMESFVLILDDAKRKVIINTAQIIALVEESKDVWHLMMRDTRSFRIDSTEASELIQKLSNEIEI